jgi:hypothetical protein
VGLAGRKVSKRNQQRKRSGHPRDPPNQYLPVLAQSVMAIEWLAPQQLPHSLLGRLEMMGLPIDGETEAGQGTLSPRSHSEEL